MHHRQSNMKPMIPILRSLISCFVLFFSATYAVSQTNSLTIGDPGVTVAELTWTGKIYNNDSNEPVGNAVMRSDQGVNAVSDLDGQFEITMSPGTYEFTISALGYGEQAISVTAYSSARADISLEVESILVEEVTIGGQDERSVITEITPGLQRLDADALQVQSKFFGEIDVLRSIQSISGVTNTGEGASGFNVRGGNTDQNLILQDGHLIFNPSHALGFFSLFHPDLVEHLDLYKGSTPAKYGGRLSSVLAVETKDGDRERLKVNGGIGLISSRLSVEGPIVKDKVSFIVGTRYSYADWVFGLVDNPEVSESSAFFNDVTAKISGRITPTTSIGGSFLRSKDDFQLGSEARFDYSTVSGEAFLKQLIGDKANLTLNVNKGRYESSLYDLKGNDQSKFTNAIDYIRSKADVLVSATDRVKLNAGVDLNIYDVSPGVIEPQNMSIVIPDELEREKGRELSGYVESQFTFSDRLEMSLGGRYTQFSNIGPGSSYTYPEGSIKTESNITGVVSYADGETIASYSGFEPRASLKYDIDDNTTVKGGYSRVYQYLAQISNTASATPIDIWQLSNEFIEPAWSDNFSVGLFKILDKKYSGSIEAFYRKSDNILDYRDFAILLLNDHVETELVVGNAVSYGFELNAQKSVSDFTWNLNYTYSSSQRQITPSETQVGVNRGEWFSSNYDIPHVFNLNMVKKWNKSDLSVNFTYRSGRPTTAPVSSFTTDNVLNIPIYSDRNKFRVPAFHRLDIAYTLGPYEAKNGRFDHSITLSVYNLYSRRNAYSVYFRQNPFESVKAIRVATLGSIFPAITFNFNLK